MAGQSNSHLPFVIQDGLLSFQGTRQRLPNGFPREESCMQVALLEILGMTKPSLRCKSIHNFSGFFIYIIEKRIIFWIWI
jgi:hypothetical protein